jgi:hypothetical protein
MVLTLQLKSAEWLNELKNKIQLFAVYKKLNPLFEGNIPQCTASY